MNRLLVALLSIFFLTLLGCISDDDSSRFVFLSVDDALTFQNNENYIVGDTIFVEINFSRYLPEEGYENLLDVFESSGAETFYYDYRLSKFSELADGFQSVFVDPNFLFVEKGNIDDFRGASIMLNVDKAQYESRVGLVLAETGRFKFDFEFLNMYSENYSQDNVQIEIQNRFSGTPPNFEFIVTEE